MPVIRQRKSNKLYRGNLAKGQTGLSIAFDLPTQTAYDADHVLARGEVGKVGVPVGHLGDMRALFDQIKVEEMNTSMTINAPAAWLLSLYVALADEQGCDRRSCRALRRTTSSRNTCLAGRTCSRSKPSMRLIGDMVAWCYTEYAEMRIRSTSAAITCRKPARRRSRSWRLRWRRRARCSTR